MTASIDYILTCNRLLSTVSKITVTNNIELEIDGEVFQFDSAKELETFLIDDTYFDNLEDAIKDVESSIA